ncbi:hypothetical protein [Streptomyces sp. PD-S100-1]|uniref:hypothetical protein n=1 Tax=Streptomyces sp. PD-S100-1 TaxID=3394351 RepID=UPI0039BC3D14
MSGRPVRIPAAPVAAHVRALLDAGMGWTRITQAAHCSTSTIARILNGQELMRRTAAERILAVNYRPAPGRTVDATGTRRRIQALLAVGHTIVGIATESSVDHSVINDILNGCENVRGMTADRIAAAYDWLAQQPPTTDRKSSATVSRKRAQREGWAPPICWNDDHIDDPTATPDWTGHCGTDRGWWLHRLETIPVCPPCETAHTTWLAERAHLTASERWTALGLAQRQARTREADLAADARELLRYGADIEQAAERLRVTKQHLQQALKRHPEPGEQVAA